MQVFSFKLRGAYNKMTGLTPEQRDRGVICSSAGNHAQGVALAAHKLVRTQHNQPVLYDNATACLAWNVPILISSVMLPSLVM